MITNPVRKYTLFSISLIIIFHMPPLYGDPFFTAEEYLRLKSAVAESVPRLKPYVDELQSLADKMQQAGPWTVTDYSSPARSGNPHDYYSESPYWWPDPVNPAGPYIRKDGLRNPERFMDHKTALIRMYQGVFVLSLAAWLFDNRDYADHAAELIRVWFLDEATRMNPHLEYAQAIRNKSPGRGVGIIDTHRFIALMESFYVLDQSGFWKADDRDALKQWFSDYLRWLTISKNGLDEMHQGNNHTTWWCTQVASYASFTGETAYQNMVFIYARDSVIEQQIDAEGRMPEEEKRTRSFDYMNFNLNAFSLLARLANRHGIDLWRTENSRGGILTATVAFMFPYILNPGKWQLEQITRIEKKERLFLYFAGRDLDHKEYLDAYRSLIRSRSLKDYESTFDPFILLVNLMSLTERE